MMFLLGPLIVRSCCAVGWLQRSGRWWRLFDSSHNDDDDDSTSMPHCPLFALIHPVPYSFQRHSHIVFGWSPSCRTLAPTTDLQIAFDLFFGPRNTHTGLLFSPRTACGQELFCGGPTPPSTTRQSTKLDTVEFPQLCTYSKNSGMDDWN